MAKEKDIFHVYVEERTNDKQFVFLWEEAEKYSTLKEVAQRATSLAIDLAIGGKSTAIKYKLPKDVDDVYGDINLQKGEDSRNITATPIFYRKFDSREIAIFKEALREMEEKTFYEIDGAFCEQELENRRKESPSNK